MAKETSPPSHTRLREARKAAGLTQEQAATLVGVVVRTLSGWEVSGTSERNVRHALTVYREHAVRQKMPAKTSGRVVAEPGTGGLLVEGYAPRGVIRGEWLAMLQTEPAEGYLDEVHGELRKLRVPHDEHDAAMRAVRQPPDDAARQAGAPWTPEEVVHVMKQRADPILEMWRIWARMR